MRRYLAFAFGDFYPSGGMQDLVGSYDNLDDAKERLNNVEWGGFHDDHGNGHVFDTQTQKIVFAYINDPGDTGCVVENNCFDVDLDGDM